MGATGSCRLGSDRERTAEHHVGANGCGRLAGADQFKVPERVADIADQNRAGQSSVRYHEFLVGAAIEIAEHDLLTALSPHEIARGEHTDAGDLQVGRYDAA